jgi:hypothetical protein
LTVPPYAVRHCRRQPCYDPASAWERYEASGAVSSEPETRSARENTRRRCASSKHARLGCRYAPLPGCRAWGSGTMPFPATTRRSKLDFAARALHPTQVRTGFFPVSGSSTRAVIAYLVYRVAMSGVPGEVRVPGSSRPRDYASAEASAALAPSAVSAVEARGAGAEAPTAPSERMSIRQPVSRAASRAFCPSLPMASDSW